jgi:hypothetical protein
VAAAYGSHRTYVKVWLRGFGSRLWFSAKLIALLPTLILLFLLAPLWWLLTGRPLDPPEWMNRIMDPDYPGI